MGRHNHDIIMESIHGHEVMHLIADSKQALPKAGWITEIGEKFGGDARFHTCSAENMDAGELLDFLNARGKFVVQGDTWSLEESAICQH